MTRRSPLDRVGKRFCLAALAALLAACQDDITPTATPNPPSTLASAQASPVGAANGRGRGLEQEGPLGRFAAENPAFGGWFQNRDGDVVVWVLDPEKNGPNIRAAVAREIASEPRDMMDPRSNKIKLLRANFSFLQLSDWRDSVSTLFDRFPGLNWTDLDDVRNRVSVGVDTWTTGAMVRQSAEAMGLPRHALTVSTASADECTPTMIDCNDPCTLDPTLPGCEDPCSVNPDDPSCYHDPCTDDPSDPACNPESEQAADTTDWGIRYDPEEVPGTLSGYFPQLQGGIQIAYEHATYGPSTCSLGFIAKSAQFGPVVVTAGHCSNAVGRKDPNEYFQPIIRRFPDNYVFGKELHDPDLDYIWSDLKCWLGCRNSDANFISTSLDGVSRPYALGKVARPHGPKTRIQDTTTHLSGGQLTIWRETRPTRIGTTIHKIGRTTGWTYGKLTYYCLRQRGYYCQDGANYIYREGDSGAPVFQWTASGAIALIGVHHSKYDRRNYDQSVYSPLARMRTDLGSFQTYPNGPY